jgi:serine O-acetyltransferase
MKSKEILLMYKINALLDAVGLLEYDGINQYEILQEVLLDLKAYLEKDPASSNNINLVINGYLSFEAVVAYRVANYIHHNIEGNFFKIKARKISEIAKIKTGVAIHPSATIGTHFVIDHGTGTVIGETAIIGNHCYILQGVIIGAKSIAKNPSEKRHPTILNNVEIGAYSRVLGDIVVGNNVFIAPHSIVTHDLPDNTRYIKNIKMTA